MTDETTAKRGQEPEQDWLIETFCQQIEEATAEGEDAVPAIFYGSKEHGNALCPLNMIQMPTFQMVLKFATDHLAKEFGKADWIVLTSETYSHAPIPEGDPHPGDLQTLFKAGDPNVSEAAMVHFVRADGTGFAMLRNFRRVESVLNGETIVIWDDDPRIDQFTADEIKLGGGVPSILLNATKWSEG